MARKSSKKVTDNPLYHDTWQLLKKYRDVVWSLELSVQQVKTKFQIEFGKSIDDFLESIYLAGADLGGTEIEHHARCIQRSAQMVKLLNGALELLHEKHKDGEAFYWLLYYTYIVPKAPQNAYEVIDKLRPHIRDISYATYFRRRQDAIEALGSILWGYSSKDTMDLLEYFFPDTIK